MDLHPLLIHFPLGLLSLYSVLEIFRFSILRRQVWYFYVKAVLVLFGALGAIAAVLAGLYAKQQYSDVPVIKPAIEMHQKFALTTLAIFGIIALSYLIVWVNTERPLQNLFMQKVLRFSKVIVETKLVWFLAVLGFMTLTITGGIGGAMVHGVDVDPFFKPVYNFLLGK